MIKDMLILANPSRTRLLAVAPFINPKIIAISVSMLILAFIILIVVTANAMLTKPLEGLLNLAELGLVILVVGRSISRFTSISDDKLDAARRSALVLASVLVPWVIAGTAVLLICAIFEIQLNLYSIGSLVVELIILVLMVIHAFRSIDKAIALRPRMPK